MVSNNAILSVNQIGSASASIGNMTLNGAASGAGATVALAPTVANNPGVPMVNCSTLTLNGTNTISIPLETIGTIALIKYNGSLAGSGNCTNLALPQGAAGYISNSAAASTLYAVITSTGPGIVWSGTNNVAGHTNLWDISTTTNWWLGVTPTSYHQVVIPGDAVTFNDSGSGTVYLSNSAGPTSFIISNTAKAYTFTGSGIVTGPTTLQKLGTNIAVLNFTNCSYLGNTIVSNGTLQVGNSTVLPSATVLNIGPSGTVELAGNNLTAGELTGSGILDENIGSPVLLSVGTESA